MARSSWTGAITFAGFPINVAAYAVTSKSVAGFKMLDPNHKLPVQQKLVDVAGEEVQRADTLKGVEVGKDRYVALDPAAVEMIQAVDRSVTVDVERFAPLDSVPLNLATGAMRLIPDSKVPGSEQPVQILWNGLRATNRAAIITDWCPRSGARPVVLAIYADDDGLIAHTLPYATDLNDVPNMVPVENEQAATMFEQLVSAQYECGDFTLADYEDGHAARRQLAIDAALNGEVIEAPASAPAKPSAPDLMAAMAAALGDKPAPAKAPAKAKKAKATA